MQDTHTQQGTEYGVAWTKEIGPPRSATVIFRSHEDMMIEIARMRDQQRVEKVIVREWRDAK